MSEQSPLERIHFRKYKRPILVLTTITFLAIVLVIPIIPIQSRVTKTRTRNLQYYSQLSDKKYVNVTNTDSIGGNFSVTINYWVTSPMTGDRVALVNTSTQSSFINAGASQVFYVPSDWRMYQLDHLLDYSVSTSAQEAYDVTITEYKSVLAFIFRQ